SKLTPFLLSIFKILVSLLYTYASRYLFFFFNDTATTEIYTLSLHDALPIFLRRTLGPGRVPLSGDVSKTPQFSGLRGTNRREGRSEEHTSELQSRFDLVCRLLLEKKKKQCTQISDRRKLF